MVVQHGVLLGFGMLMLGGLGCGGDPSSGTGEDSGASGVPLPEASTGQATEGAGDAGSGGEPGEKFDLPVSDGTMGMGDDGTNAEGCEKVDFLFVIDSSGSMEDEQDNLLASFPGFINAIEQTLEIDDFNLMVIDAGEVKGSGCDGALGSGRTRSGNLQDCGIEGDQRFATSAQSDLINTFTCIASRGTDGSGDEQTMDALVASIGDLAAPGECNEGFLRDDAILVVTIITDEEDSPQDTPPVGPGNGTCGAADADPNSSGDPASWQSAVVAAKDGRDEAVVVLSLIGDCDMEGTCPAIQPGNPFDPTSGITGAEPAPRLRAFTGMFGYGSVGPVCAEDYSPFFEEAVSVIESACDDFVPQG